MDLNKLKSVVKGDVFSDEETLAQVRGDFGGMVQKLPGAVVVPAAIEDVRAVVELASREGWPVSTRGSSHSQGGQSLSDGGILLDMSALNRVEWFEHETVCVQAGARWSDLVGETLQRGCVPPVLTSDLGATVGGGLSTGGLGAASFRFGTQADHVEEMEVVTGDGHLVHCSVAENPELFDASRCGLGQFSVIGRARLRLRKCLPRVRTYRLLYDDLGTLLGDLRKVSQERRFGHVESWCAPCLQGFRRLGETSVPLAEWFFPAHLSVEYDGNEPRDESFLSGLRFYRKVHVEDSALADFVHRSEPLFSLWKHSGAWNQPHPWMECLLPWEGAAPYILGLLRGFPPHLLGSGQVVLWPCRTPESTPPLLMCPRGSLFLGFGLLPAIPRQFLPMALPLLKKASDLCRQIGGKRYLSGWVDFDHAHWQEHFGDNWAKLLACKRFYDPAGILNPGFIKYTHSEGKGDST